MSNRNKSLKSCYKCQRPTEIQGGVIRRLNQAQAIYPTIGMNDLPIKSRVRACGFCGHVVNLPPEILVEEPAA